MESRGQQGKSSRRGIDTVRWPPGMHELKTTLTISSRNYSSWSLRGWLLARMSGIEFETMVVPPEDTAARAELLLLSPSILVPTKACAFGTRWRSPNT
jgi:hypothetical protein